MAEFAPNKPVVVREPTVDVDKGLPAGQHLFQLQVEDNLGQLSETTQVTVIIFRQIGIGGIFLRFKPPR